jgi:hypothetical protein
MNTDLVTPRPMNPEANALNAALRVAANHFRKLLQHR